MNTLKITRIVRVVDTRDWQEVGDDRWEPIPGSGIENACHRCGRNHEVHAHVMLEDNTTAVIGTGCARGDDLIKAAAFTSAANAAKRIVQLRTKLASAEAEAAVFEEARAKVAAMTAPRPVWSDKHFAGPEKGSRCDVGDAHVFCLTVLAKVTDWDRKEREECARSAWKANRVTELLPAGKSVHATPGRTVWELKAKIEKTQKRLNALMTPAPAAV